MCPQLLPNARQRSHSAHLGPVHIVISLRLGLPNCTAWLGAPSLFPARVCRAARTRVRTENGRSTPLCALNEPTSAADTRDKVYCGQGSTVAPLCVFTMGRCSWPSNPWPLRLISPPAPSRMLRHLHAASRLRASLTSSSPTVAPASVPAGDSFVSIGKLRGHPGARQALLRVLQG